jgi:hypothetical protein
MFFDAYAIEVVEQSVLDKDDVVDFYDQIRLLEFKRGQEHLAYQQDVETEGFPRL